MSRRLPTRLRAAALSFTLALSALVACSGTGGPSAGEACAGAQFAYDPATGKISLPELSCPSGQALACCSGKWTPTDVCTRCGELTEGQIYCTVTNTRFTICGRTFSSTITSTSTGS